MKMKITNIGFGLMTIVLLNACQKKQDFRYDNRINTVPMASSSVRLVNLAGAMQLKVNGVKLTSFMQPDPDGYVGADQTRGTIYFPETGRLGLTYSIPQQFVNASGWIDSIMFSSLGNKYGLSDSRNFRAKDDFNNPHDYYYVRLRPNRATFQDSLIAVPKSVSPSSNPTSFKIRLLNLSSVPDQYSTPGVFRKGPMTLAWADGTPIAEAKDIAPGKYSDYIEIPYGTYQFKVLDQDSREVQGNSSFTLNTSTGTLMDYYGDRGVGGKYDTWLTYAPIKTFQPGGVYTIAVSMNYDCEIPTGNPNGETVKTEGNTFRIISDISEPVNNIYAKVQGVNAIDGQDVQWLVNDQPLGDFVAFTKPTIYKSYVTGNYTLRAVDKKNVLVAQKEISLQPGDNLTAWLYKEASGTTAITVSANNLSSKFYTGKAEEEGSYSTFKDGTPNWIRFMNLCSEVKEATFTTNNGQPFLPIAGSVATNASQHIQLGKSVTQDPYVQLALNMPGQIVAYASSPGVTPGDWLQQITPLNSRDFIANTSLYKTPSLPNREPGYYTVALVGNTISTARMIIIKHNK